MFVFIPGSISPIRFGPGGTDPPDQNFHGAVQEPIKNFLRDKYPGTFLFYRIILNRSDIESFRGGSRTAPWKFSDIAAHLDFRNPICSCLNY